MYIIGIDIGSLTTKVALIKDKKLIDTIVERSGHNFEIIGKKLVDMILEKNKLERSDIESIISTGYGRHSLPDIADDIVTEITAHARGVQFFIPDVRSIIDIGGQDSKVITIDTKSGNVIDFQMNDKCAAGTGRFLEVMARALEVELSEFGPLALKSKNPEQISSMCTVFAESEVISLFAHGRPKVDIAAGIHKSISKRVASMAKRLNVQPKLVFCGGVALNSAIKKELENALKIKIIIPKMPQLTGAIGAALVKYDRIEEKLNV